VKIMFVKIRPVKSMSVKSMPVKIMSVKLRGFTLVEVLIALTILSIGFLAIMRSNVFNIRSSREASDLTLAVFAAEMMMKEEIAKGYPQSAIEEGEFEEGPYAGYRWKRTVEVVEFPFIEELKLVTVEIGWREEKHYTLRTVLSRY